MASNSKNTLAIRVNCDAPIEKVWAKIADWSSQGEWMVATRVWVTSEISEGVGTSIAAFTGPAHRIYPKFSFLGLLDTMTVTAWEPPTRCDVIHTGKVLKGTGTFQLESTGPHSSTFYWSETIDIHRALFLLGAPFIWLGVRISLARFARHFKTL
jgi:uncharacterized protein YndB with AHSA1/START domain